MKRFSGWSGTDKELLYILAEGTRDFRENYPELTDREFKSLLCASLASNVVQSEIAGHAAFEFDNGHDGSAARKKLDELVGKYR